MPLLSRLAASSAKGYGLGNLRTINLTISSSIANINLYALAGNPSSAVILNVIINSGVSVYSTSATNPSLTTGNLSSGSKIYLINNGNIIGAGGQGGSVSTNAVEGNSGYIGQVGGTAILTTVPTIITNNGVVAGGGGGGHGINYTSFYDNSYGAGGGGAGYNAGTGGSPTTRGQAGGNGQSFATFGVAAVGGAGGFDGTSSQNGGKGGAIGIAATDYNGTSNLGTNNNGLAGYYINGSSNTTWLVNGTRLGRTV
jgi:hypothetical protein